jgi:hypothetical protein
METLAPPTSTVEEFLERIGRLNARYRAGDMRVHVPEAFCEGDRALDDLVRELLPASNAALEAASSSLFFSLPVAFDPAQSVGPYLAIVDRDAAGEPYRFLDMGALIATQRVRRKRSGGSARGARVVAVCRVALRAFRVSDNPVAPFQGRAEPDRAGRHPAHFVVNTGAEAVENAIKAALMNRVMTSPDGDGGFIVSFDGAFHGRTLGRWPSPTARRRASAFRRSTGRTFRFRPRAPAQPKETDRREERSLKQLWDLLVSGKMPHAEKSRDTYRREMDAIDRFLARPEHDVDAFVQTQHALLTADVVRRSRRVAAVLVEPIQGEGGVRIASARFMRQLRLLHAYLRRAADFRRGANRMGMDGRAVGARAVRSAVPRPTWSPGQEGAERRAVRQRSACDFFQEEKKFNTTWEGDSVGMVRLLAVQDKLDLDAVRRTGDRAPARARGAVARLSRDS